MRPARERTFYVIYCISKNKFHIRGTTKHKPLWGVTGTLYAYLSRARIAIGLIAHHHKLDRKDLEIWELKAAPLETK